MCSCSSLPGSEDVESPKDDGDDVGAPSSLWSTAIGLAKLQGDTDQIGQRFVQALDGLSNLRIHDSQQTHGRRDHDRGQQSGRSKPRIRPKEAGQQLRKQGVPKELSAGVAATIMAGRRFDGSYPLDRFANSENYFLVRGRRNTGRDERPYDGLSTKFQAFRSMFTSWGYMTSEDTEIASAFLAIGELDADEVGGEAEVYRRAAEELPGISVGGSRDTGFDTRVRVPRGPRFDGEGGYFALWLHHRIGAIRIGCVGSQDDPRSSKRAGKGDRFHSQDNRNPSAIHIRTTSGLLFLVLSGDRGSFILSLNI